MARLRKQVGLFFGMLRPAVAIASLDKSPAGDQIRVATW
jgi:hypothetical protein